jgi:cysteinyl-tRNA synthetase
MPTKPDQKPDEKPDNKPDEKFQPTQEKKCEDVFVYNNLTRNKELFKTITPGEVKFYSCGPTTYDFLHVGNGRALITGDLFHRTLLALGYKVTFVRNYTDVDDKIIDRANELHTDPIEHAAKFILECEKDLKHLNMLPPTFTPKVSETIPEIITIIEKLIENKTAYNVNGEILYHVPSFKKYGQLSKMDLEQLQHGKRVEVDSHKKNPADFVLWKPAKINEPSWDSPWGKGRPGWHIECSAMAFKFLGTTLDLHHGGVDLIFPHHENEMAQSEAAHGKEFCHYWCHNEFVNFAQEKMSKSLGNMVTIRQFVENYSGPVLRQIYLSSHYRTKVEWSQEIIERAIHEVERIHHFALELKHSGLKYETSLSDSNSVSVPKDIQEEYEKIYFEMKKDLADDFNTAGALGKFFSFIRLVRRHLSLQPKSLPIIVKDIFDFAKLSLGLIYDDAQGVLDQLQKFKKRENNSTITPEEIQGLIEQRAVFKSQKEFAKADAIRNELKSKGIILKDNPNGPTTWEFS